MTHCYFCNSKLNKFAGGSSCSDLNCFDKHGFTFNLMYNRTTFKYKGNKIIIYPKENITQIQYAYDIVDPFRHKVIVPMAFDATICSLDSFLERAQKLSAFS